MEPIVCDKCGKVPYGMLDGYEVGERVLEGVKFHVTVSDFGKKKIVVAVSPDDVDYFSTVNTRKWLSEMRAYAKETDVWTCPKCGTDMENPLFEEPATVIPLKKLQLVTMEGILSKG